jgi:hypothetical protein
MPRLTYWAAVPKCVERNLTVEATRTQFTEPKQGPSIAYFRIMPTTPLEFSANDLPERQWRVPSGRSLNRLLPYQKQLE